MLQTAIALILGIFAGTFTGLAPGIHINLISLLVFSFSPVLMIYFGIIPLAVFIVAMAITHTFLDFVPSIFLGAPDEDTILSVLPGHKLLLEGRGHEAVMLTLRGSFAGLFIILILTPLFVYFLPKVYPVFKEYMALILIAASAFLIITEKKSRFWALFLFLLSGILGIATLNLSGIKQPLFPLLSGLFGCSLLIISVMSNVKVPPQKITHSTISKKETFKALLSSTIAAPLCSFLPGLGASQAAVIGSEITRNLGEKPFLVLLGAINTIVMGLSFVALYAIQKPRTGAAVIVGKLIQDMTLGNLLLFLVVMFIAGIIASFLTIAASRFFAKNIAKLNYRSLCLVVILLITILTIPLSGALGLLVLATGTAMGIVAALTGIRKMHLMGCLLVPVIFYFL